MTFTTDPRDLLEDGDADTGLVTDPRKMLPVINDTTGLVTDPLLLIQASSADGGGTTDPNLIDDFEDQSLDDYDAMPSDEPQFAFVTSPVANGTYALQCEYTGSTEKMVSTSGLNAYPAQGDTFRFNMQFSTGAFSGLYYGLQDEYHKYLIRPNSGAGAFQLYLETGQGAWTPLDEQTGITIPTGEMMEIEVDWQATTTCTLYNAAGSQLAQVSTTDTTWTSGGIGLESNSSNASATTTWDYIRKV